MLVSTGALVLGILLLYLGAEWLVKGAAGLGRALGVRPLVIGLTAVAYGTSAPELVVSTVAALQGRSLIALGNVVGSNIANLGLVLGLTALIAPLRVEGRLIRREIPVLLVTALAVPAVLLDGGISRLDAALLLAGAAGFTILAARPGLPDPVKTAALVEADAEAAGAPAGAGRLRLTVIAVCGLGLLIGGGKLFVDGAAGLALVLGVSERVVGLTIVAVGTSAPELAASLVAALRGHAAIAVGNVIGSNIFNVLFVLGGAALIRPIRGAVLWLDTGTLLGISALAAAMLRGERTLSRAEAAVLLAVYFAFVTALLYQTP